MQTRLSHLIDHPAVQWHSTKDPMVLISLLRTAGVTRASAVRWLMTRAGFRPSQVISTERPSERDVLFRSLWDVVGEPNYEARIKRMRTLYRESGDNRNGMEFYLTRFACSGINTALKLSGRIQYEEKNLARYDAEERLSRHLRSWLPDYLHRALEYWIAASCTLAVSSAGEGGICVIEREVLRNAFSWEQLVALHDPEGTPFSESWSILVPIVRALEPNPNNWERRLRIADVLDESPSGPSPKFARTVRESAEALMRTGRWGEADMVLHATFGKAIASAVSGVPPVKD